MTQVYQRNQAVITLFDANEEQSKKEVDGLRWATNKASEKEAQAERAIKDRDGVIQSLQEKVAAAEVKASAAESDFRGLQTSVQALRLRDANEAVDVGAYNILLGRLEVLRAAEGGVVGAWRLEEVKAEMDKWYPEEGGIPGARFVEFLEENKEEEGDGAGDERTASTASGTV